MFRTQRKSNDFDIAILNKLSEYLAKAITNLKLAYYRQIASKFNDLTRHLKLIHSKVVC